MLRRLKTGNKVFEEPKQIYLHRENQAIRQTRKFSHFYIFANNILNFKNINNRTNEPDINQEQLIILDETEKNII